MSDHDPLIRTGQGDYERRVMPDDLGPIRPVRPRLLLLGATTALVWLVVLVLACVGAWTVGQWMAG